MYIEARIFTNTSYFNDDLCPIDDKGVFEKHFNEVYPEELELKKLNLSSTFQFKIIRMPFFNSNIPLNMFYSFICSKIPLLVRKPKEGYQKITK